MTNLTFGQAQGLEPLPSQAQLGTISQETVAQLWRVVYLWLHKDEYGGEPSDPVQLMLQAWWSTDLYRMIDEAPDRTSDWEAHLKAELLGGFHRALNLVQALLGYEIFSRLCSILVESILEETRAAYRLVAGRIVPFASPEEHNQILAAVETATESGAAGAKAHLLNAAAHLTAGKWGAAIQECMAAVEGAARVATGEHGKDLGAILLQLRKSGRIKHPALAEALTKLYAYTSDEKGLRHSLVLKDTADVSEGEAFLLLGLCASFVTYVLRLPAD